MVNNCQNIIFTKKIHLYYKTLKYFLDFSFAFLLLLVFAPILIICIIVLAIELKQFPLFVQKRPGLRERLFNIYKLKTMTDDLDSQGNLLSDSKRITSVGRWIRKFSIDELPQIFNVIKGDMSFVGPRPLLIEYLPLYNQNQKKRHSVKPGITGWAQVNGRNAISWKEKFEFDIWYVEHQNFRTDIKIIFKTIGKVFGAKQINSTNNITMEKFNGNN